MEIRPGEYKKRNKVERLFRRLKSDRRVFSHFAKLNLIFTGFIMFALICNMLHQHQHGLEVLAGVAAVWAFLGFPFLTWFFSNRRWFCVRC